MYACRRCCCCVLLSVHTAQRVVLPTALSSRLPEYDAAIFIYLHVYCYSSACRDFKRNNLYPPNRKTIPEKTQARPQGPLKGIGVDLGFCYFAAAAAATAAAATAAAATAATAAATAAPTVGYSADSGGSSRDLRPEFGAFLCDGSCDSGAFHFSFVVANNSCIVFKIYKVPLGSPPCTALSYNNSWVHLLPQLRLSLLYCCQHQVPQRARRQSVKARAPALKPAAAATAARTAAAPPP